MKVESYYYKNVEEFRRGLEGLNNLNNKLLLLFGACSVGELRKAHEFMNNLYPDVEKVGLTVAASVLDGNILKEGYLLSVISEIEFKVISSASEELDAAREIGSSLKEKKEGVVVVLSDGVRTQGEIFLKNLKKIVKIPVVGAKASTMLIPVETAVFHNQSFSQRLIVAIYVNWKDFKHYYVFDWEDIGKEFLVTKAKGNRVFSINHFPACEFYRYYLGSWVAEKLPFSGVEFPLIFEVNGIKVARACVQKHEDGSLSFAGCVPEAAYVKLGCGDLSKREETLNKITKELGGYEYYFLFPCIARWIFLQEEAEKEISLLRGKKSIGFLTFGEFYEDVLLNETLTVIAFNRVGSLEVSLELKDEKKTEKYPFRAVAHLLSRISKEFSLLKDAINNNEFGVLILSDVSGNGEKKCIYASKSLEAITGYKSEDFILGKIKHEDIIYREDFSKIEELVRLFKAGKVKETVIECRILTANGDIKWIRSYAKCNDGTILLSILDISSRKEIEFLSIKDQLTQLYNREYAFRKLKELMEEGRNFYSAVLFLDLDRFKVINDVYGHDIGDEILKIVSKRIKDSVRGVDIPCRFGGDEFIVILPNLSKDKSAAEEKATKVANRILKRLSQPIFINGKEFLITASIGISLFNSDGSPQDVVKFADMAMYNSKEKGRNRITIFSYELKDKAEKLEEVERELRKEVLNDKFSLVYQPIFCLSGEKLRLCGFEVLTRFNSKILKEKPINFLISVLEDEGLSAWLTLGLFKKLISLLDRNPILGKLKLSVNVGYRDIISQELVKGINKLVRSPNFVIEITERVFAEDYERISKILHFLKERGFKVAIDDFGTGYSCLAYLQSLPVDIIKIDKTFTKDLDKDVKKRRLVKAIYHLGSSLGMDITAEGVETREEFETLRNLGIKSFQGYFFYKPLPEKEAVRLAYKYLGGRKDV